MGFPSRYGWSGPVWEALHLRRFKDVFAAWASQEYESGRNRRGSVYFIGPTIYSYGPHFPMAKFARNAKGQRALLFTSRSYSAGGVTGMTTEQHKGAVWSAARGWKASRYLRKMRVFTVGNPTSNVLTCVDDFEARLQELAEKAKRARSYRLWHLESYFSIASECRSFMRFFGIKKKLVLDPLVTHPEFKAHAETLQKLSFAKWELAQAKGDKSRQRVMLNPREERRRRLLAETVVSLVGRRAITVE